jgi:hypothetical protein
MIAGIFERFAAEDFFEEKIISETKKSEKPEKKVKD